MFFERKHRLTWCSCKCDSLISVALGYVTKAIAILSVDSDDIKDVIIADKIRGINN